MKKLLFVVVITLKSAMFLSQTEDSYTGTTLEEYNYVTKGYAVQLEQGLDMKAGYEIMDWESFGINTSDEGEIMVQINDLWKKNTSMEMNYRATMVIISSSLYDFKQYLCIPNYYSSSEMWNRYFDEIKLLNQNYLLALSWRLSKRIPDSHCFPANSLIKLANGSDKEIQNITKGDTVSSYNFEKQSVEPAIVDELLVHSNRMFEITKINISISDNLIASLNDFLAPSITLEATNNHPIFTNNGVKAFGELNTDDKVYFFSEDLNKLILCNISSIEKNYRTTQKVYNLKLLNSANFIVNGTIVKTK